MTELAQAFGLGEVESCEALGNGHIHRTILARCGGRAFVMQRLNDRVFPDLDALLENAERITDHLRRQLLASGTAEIERRVLRLLHTQAGALSHRDEAGRLWRCCRFIDGSVSRSQALGSEDARAAARAFGAFAVALDDLEPAPTITLPGFHDLPGRRAELEAAADADVSGHAVALADEIGITLRLCDRLLLEHDLTRLPVRIVHNDCKLNNLLFDARSGEALCILDLDTVMEGSVVYDFGELVRTASCRADEAERDLTKVHVDPLLLAALTAGYVDGAEGLLTREELEALPLAGARLALENSLRFLTDHLAGDIYFRIERIDHNLDRHRAQRRLSELLFAETEAVAAQLRF